VARGLSSLDPDPVDAVLDAAAHVDEQAAMFAVWVADVPERYRRSGLGDFTFEIAEQARGWAAERTKRPALVLAGPTGTGKTRLAYAITRHLFVEREISSWALLPMPMLLSMLRPGGSGDADSFTHLATHDLLVLDDVGAERPTDWTVEQMDALVDLRWRYGLPTIVTTNLTGAEFRAHVGDRVHSRLVVDGVAVTLTGADRRGDPANDVEDALVPGLPDQPEPGKRCTRCAGLGVIDVPQSYVRREGHHAVIPCSVCRPEQYRLWGEGKFAPTGLESRVPRRAANEPPEQAPLPIETTAEPPPEPEIDQRLPYADD
jgi:DNA replication protein DnaC